MSEIWTVKKILDWTIDYFQSKDIPEPRLSAEWLLADVLSCQRIALYVQFERMLTVEERKTYREFVQRRIKREPVQYILGKTEFYGHPILVNKSVLIPRPDTEILIDCVIENLKSRSDTSFSIADIGTGSGCIAISLAKQFPNAKVSAVDISEDALEVATENAVQNNVDIAFHNGDIFTHHQKMLESIDFIVSNPPYISKKEWSDIQPEVKSFEPHTALLAENDGLAFYEQAIPLFASFANIQGLFFEVGHTQSRQVAAILEENHFKPQIRNDYRNIERVVYGFRKV